MKDAELTALNIAGNALSTLGNSNRLEIAEFLRVEKKATFGEIRDKFGFNDNTARFHLKKLMEARLVEQTMTRGNYALTELGEEALLLVNEFSKLDLLSVAE